MNKYPPTTPRRAPNLRKELLKRLYNKRLKEERRIAEIYEAEQRHMAELREAEEQGRVIYALPPEQRLEQRRQRDYQRETEKQIEAAQRSMAARLEAEERRIAEIYEAERLDAEQRTLPSPSRQCNFNRPNEGQVSSGADAEVPRQHHPTRYHVDRNPLVDPRNQGRNFSGTRTPGCQRESEVVPGTIGLTHPAEHRLGQCRFQDPVGDLQTRSTTGGRQLVQHPARATGNLDLQQSVSDQFAMHPSHLVGRHAIHFSHSRPKSTSDEFGSLGIGGDRDINAFTIGQQHLPPFGMSVQHYEIQVEHDAGYRPARPRWSVRRAPPTRLQRPLRHAWAARRKQPSMSV